MNLRLVAAAAATALGLGVVGAAQATVIGFDDIPDHSSTGDSPIANPYDGFIWDNVYVSGTGVDCCGYDTGVVSKSHDAYDGYGEGGSFRPVSGTFTFNSVYVTGAFGDQNVTFDGWRLGSLVDTATVFASGSGPTKYTFNWSDIDNVSFIGWEFQTVLDNVAVNGGAVPEPATWAMMILGMGAAGSALRRRRAPSLA